MDEHEAIKSQSTNVIKIIKRPVNNQLLKMDSINTSEFHILFTDNVLFSPKKSIVDRGSMFSNNRIKNSSSLLKNLSTTPNITNSQGVQQNSNHNSLHLYNISESNTESKNPTNQTFKVSTRKNISKKLSNITSENDLPYIAIPNIKSSNIESKAQTENLFNIKRGSNYKIPKIGIKTRSIKDLLDIKSLMIAQKEIDELANKNK